MTTKEFPFAAPVPITEQVKTVHVQNVRFMTSALIDNQTHNSYDADQNKCEMVMTPEGLRITTQKTGKSYVVPYGNVQGLQLK